MRHYFNIFKLNSRISEKKIPFLNYLSVWVCVCVCVKKFTLGKILWRPLTKWTDTRGHLKVYALLKPQVGFIWTWCLAVEILMKRLHYPWFCKKKLPPTRESWQEYQDKNEWEKYFWKRKGTVVFHSCKWIGSLTLSEKIAYALKHKVDRSLLKTKQTVGSEWFKMWTLHSSPGTLWDNISNTSKSLC